MSKVTIVQFYISTGSKGIHHTLRKTTNTVGDMRQVDSYVKNLAVCKEKAIESAKSYVEKFTNIIGSNPNFQVIFDEIPRHITTHSWGDGKLPNYKLTQLEDIEHGIMPFGKHKGMLFVDVPSEYLGWCCEQGTKKENDKIANNLASASLAVLIERKVITCFDDLEQYVTSNNQKRKEQDMLSEYVGLQGERLELELKIEHASSKWDETYHVMRHFYKMKLGTNILTYYGTVELGEKDETIKLKATIGKHQLYKDVKSTLLKRPIVI